MKYHSILTPALISLCLLTSHSALATQSTESSSDEQARWFEIEIILFKQVSNNSENPEQFSATDLSAKKGRALDLLTPYLQPNITSLKQLLPNCEQPATQLPYNITPSTLWADNEDNESSEADSSDTDTIPLQSNNERGNNVTPPQIAENKENISPSNMSVTVLTAALSETESDNLDSSVKQGLSEANNPTYFNSIEPTIELPVYNQYPISSQTPLCVIPADFFQQHLTVEQLEHFSIDGFPVEKIAKTISGLEQWQDDENGEITWASDSPYLISQDSLRLKSIANRIKRSRNYAPLLHLGWRQVGESSRQTKAIRLYAGENLDLGYRQAIAKKESEQQALEIQAILEQRQQAEALFNSQMSLAINETTQATENITTNITPDNAEAINEVSIAEQLRQQAKQQQLNKLFQQFSLLDNQTDTEKTSETSTLVKAANGTIQNAETIQRIVAQLSSEITAKELQLNLKSTTDKHVDITAPLQPWSIDGLFKVHLDHYLYINTEFNIIDSSDKASVLTTKQKLTNNNNETLNQNNIISFKQDRRVITGEIHYFDHPHIGMIVQIRRFDPSKPADEAVSQSKK
ncbi:CsiV family protein [Colwellia sp. 12G3]|uniref:CsiV family protein n=1 Tax=Colwellia sp. 12G3 TaxID=2058299 RepID=UPI000C34274D|nr:CsiV family protein [Colwellia sp. 12G3]PKI17490.1 hypothetical protein CXF71_03555 [Colwellia sp. 12G3]